MNAWAGVDPFSPAQLLGYLALVLGILTYLQRDDRTLKKFNACQSVAYGLQFFLLGNIPACTGMAVSTFRSVAALYTRSIYLALALVAVNIGLGSRYAHDFVTWLPVVGVCVGTMAIFTLSGIPMRLALLSCTVMWLIINIMSGSIGGTVLETLVFCSASHTIFRLWRAKRLAAA
ncbi:conserved membrane hypothetical protein [uncultured Alphaproteobacteria bacterium]|uniref:Inner membrane protein n=1 Tax=uncultured Alphaproteobacteria bacterium TaxID=91750 RepID=A0A212KLX7_9PROT|nr:conserved membrane hypothetical protein [uncultured Alphaproteobacteria bacterium]